MSFTSFLIVESTPEKETIYTPDFNSELLLFHFKELFPASKTRSAMVATFLPLMSNNSTRIF